MTQTRQRNAPSAPQAPPELIDQVVAKNPAEPEFHQAVREVLEHIAPLIRAEPKYARQGVLQRLVEPERVIMFRVPWVDDAGQVQVNRGMRVQFNSALGPYKGGLRFHRSVHLGSIKFLGFEQVFKNALTPLPLGGGKGGSDFDPKGRSDGEVMRFCQSFMTELERHIGPRTDVPAGDIGVGPREIGYLFGQYKRLRNEFNGAITGKSPGWGGSLMRPEATGHGCVYFAQQMLAERDDTLEGKTCVVSGSGNVAQYTAEKLIEFGAHVKAMSDSGGTIHDPDGIDREKLEWIMDLKNNRRGRIREYVASYPRAEFQDGAEPWHLPCDAAFPCATQNEIDVDEARRLVKGGSLVCEGANMPVTPDGLHVLRDARVLHGPAKAANAGGVAVSGLEMAQNAQHMAWTRDEVDQRLQQIMSDIHQTALDASRRYEQPGNLALGADIAAFTRVGDAMLDQGVV